MILDYDYNQRESKFTISYINSRGGKSFYDFNIKRFKTYCASPTGKFVNWDDTRCDVRYTDKPSRFDIKEFIEDLPPQTKDDLFGRYSPRVYTWDIETEFDPQEKPDPMTAKFPITTISITNPEMNTMVLGYKDLENEKIEEIRNNIKDYLGGIPFVKKNISKGSPVGGFEYKKFDCEKDMLRWFCENIVAKVPILAGWNSDGFDQQYLTSRLQRYYEDISVSRMSCRRRVGSKKVVSPFRPTDSTRIPTPKHTVMIDLMDVIGTHDMTVLPIKDSMSLDWIANASLGVEKIKYDGDLNTLYDNDFQKYVLYNAIDSTLVQLIHRRFNTLSLMYNYANVCHIPIGECFGKILPAEALFFLEFHGQGKKVIYYPDRGVERGTLIGAYVREPNPGYYEFPCCFDFSGLYPTNICCFNLSVENYIGSFYNEPLLDKYRKDSLYIVSGPSVYKNVGSVAAPKPGELVGTYLDDERLDVYRRDPNYFVSVNGSVYKNDKDYAFKRIQLSLKENRNATKYLAKEMDAQVMSTIDKIIEGRKYDNKPFSDDVLEWMSKHYGISSKADIGSYDNIKELKGSIASDIEYMYTREQSFKLLMNSCYGGSSHPSFYWYNMAMANDITGEGRNLIHMMEDETKKAIDAFIDAHDTHDKLGITIDPEKYRYSIIDNDDMVYTIYQDTDSSYINLGPITSCINELEGKSDADKALFIDKFASEYLNPHFDKVITEYLKSRHANNYHIFELETIAKSGIWINVKKRYAQALMWKDGRLYDEPKIKVKGLEIIKGSYPPFSREILKNITHMLLTGDGVGDPNYIHVLNQKMMEYKAQFYNQSPDNICETVKVNDYWKNITSDTDPTQLQCALGTSYHQKALGMYNWHINTKKLPGDNVYGGKVKCYAVKRIGKGDAIYFAYPAGEYPSWADRYAPIDKDAMFTKTVLEPLNRILVPIGFKELHIDGSIDVDLFSSLF